MKLFIHKKKTILLTVYLIMLVSLLVANKQFDFNTWQGNYDIQGRNAFDQFGYQIMSGDFNGDGIDDIIASSPSADPLGRNSAGEVYIFWGSEQSQQNVSMDLSFDLADVTILGATSGDKLGYSIATGSFNGDSYIDFAISAPYCNNDNILQSGKVYLFYGSQSLPTTIDLNNDSAQHEFVGQSTNDYLGQKVLFTDLNNDSKDDLIISAPEADSAELNNCGLVYFVWSHETYSQNVNLAEATNISYISGLSINDNLGRTLATNNMNNDLFQDLIVGAPGVDQESLINNGRVYLLKGRTFFPYQEISLTDDNFIDMEIQGAFHSSRLGSTIAAGDINGDGFGDIAMTDYSTQAISNTLYILYGSNSLPGEIILNDNSANVRITDQTIQDNKFASKLFIGNLIPTNPEDLIICSPQALSNNGNESGLVHILYGRNQFEADYDLALATYDEIYHGQVANANLGSSIALADFNNDLKADIFIASINAGSSKGKVNSIYGGIPWVWNLLPIDGATNVDIDQAIAFSLSDNQEIDLNSIEVNIAGTSYDINSSNLSYSGSGNFYRITIAPESYFGYDQIINVTINASDNEGWQIPTTNYRFFTREDTDPPFTNQWLPAPDEQGVVVDTNIEFNVYDLGEGVDLSSIIVNVNGTNYYSGSPYFSHLGEVNNFRIIIDPPSNFTFGEEVFVSIDCQDLAPIPNTMSTFNYSFTCGQDNSAPSIIIIEPAYGEEVARSNLVFVEVADSESSLNQNSLIFNLDDENLIPFSQIETLANGNLRVTYNPLDNQLLTYGEKQIYFYIEDASNNANSIDTISVFTVVPDNQAPYTANHFPEKFTLDNPSNTQFKVDLFDLLSGIDLESLSIKINDVEIADSENTSISSLNNGYRVIYNPPERLVGQVNVEIQVSDLETPANTMPSEIYTFTTSLDTEAPYISDLYPEEASVNIPIDANLSFKIYDDKTGVDRNSIQVLIDGNDITEDLNIATIASGFDVLYLLEEAYDFNQLVNVYISCSDLEEPANTYENNYTFRVTPDVEAPSLVNFDPEPGATGVPVDSKIYFEIHDNGLGVDIESLEMKVNNQIVEPETTEIPGTMFYEVSYSGPDFEYGQQVTLVVSVADLAITPNTLTNYNYSFTVVDDDQTPPIFTGLTPAEDSSDNPVDTSISITIIDTETDVDQNSIIFKVNNDTIEDYDLSAIATEDGLGYRLTYDPLTDFAYGEIVRVQIYAMDTSSNNNASNKLYSFTTENDTQAPYLEISSPSDGGEGYANSILYLSLKDDLSGIDKESFSLIINGNYISSYQDSLHDNRLEVWYSTSGFFGVEHVDIEFSIADNVGNNYEDTYSFTIIPDTFSPYFLLINPNAGADIAIHDYLEIAILDKGVGIAEESITFILNGRSIENYNLDRDTFNSNPDSLGFILQYQIDDNYYPGQNLDIQLSAEDKNQPTALQGNQEYNIFVERVLKEEKVEVIPNIISLNFDGINDYSRIIIPTEKNVTCQIFTRSGKEIKKITTSLYLAENDTGKNYQVAIWDGKNSDNKPVNAGIYICQVKYGNKIHRNTITVAK